MSILAQVVTALLVAAAVFCVVQYVGELLGYELALARREAPRVAQKGHHRALFVRWARKLGSMVPRSTQRALARRIVMAGGLRGLTPAQLVLYGMLTGFLGLVVGVLVVLATGWSVLWLPLALALGATLPFIWLHDRVKERHLAILRDLPYHLDLLTLCVEAGLDFGAGVAKTVEKGKPGPLRQELNAYLGEIRIGKTRAEALSAMSERVGLPELSAFLTALIQADRLGTGLGRALRLQADQMRVERSQRAEKAAGEAPVKMLLPLVLFVFPTIWVILAAPLVFEWIFKVGP